MTTQDSLLATISDLINRKAEGPYWDFKLKHHYSKAKFIHDVLCLANTRHTGDRFLIFGVSNKGYSVHSINDDAGRRTQADIATLFRDNASKFFQSRFPDFYLREIKIDGTVIDVLVIADAPDKPYYLVEDYVESIPTDPPGRAEKVTVHAHHIYSRVCDANTPIDASTQPHEIERMWRERFGLDMPPLERAKRYLTEPEAWSPLVENISSNVAYYHANFPEFTLRATAAESGRDCHQEWTRGEIRIDNNHAGFFELRYHQTLLHRIPYVSFDDHKKAMVAPKWEARGPGRFYFYEADSIEYVFQKFHFTLLRGDDSLTLLIKGANSASSEARERWGSYMKIPVLRKGELEAFLGPAGKRESVSPSSDEDEQYELHIRNQLDFEDWRISQGLDNPQ